MKPSVVVVGAGVVGCTVAHQLAKEGARVTILEPRAPGQGATRASAGILAPDIEGHGSSPLRLLGRRSIAIYDDFIDGIRADSGLEIVYQRNGTFELAFSDEDVRRLEELTAQLKHDRIESRWLAPAEFDALEPRAAKNARGALLIPIHGFVGVTALTRAAAAAAQAYGATLVSGTGAIRIAAMPDGRAGVEAVDAKWEADRVVLAAGSWSSMITIQDADQVPVKPIRGQLIQLKSDPGAIRRVIWGPDGYLVPWPDGSVLVGSTVEDVGFDERHTDEAVARLRAAAASLVPELAKAELTSIRTGLRPKGPDDLPILGHSQVVPGLIYATAHYRNGVMFAPLTVKLVSDLVFDRAADAALDDLDPARHGSCNIANVMALLKPEDITERLKSLDGWALDGKAIKKQFTFQDFPEAVLFVSALVPGAEETDHHPDIEIHYKRVILTYSTHDQGGLTQKDFDGAAMADAVASSLPHLEEFGDG